jgi:S1-C subfamily serine protease
VQASSAASRGGLAAGDTIVFFKGKTIGSTTDLDHAIEQSHVGDKISIGYLDSNGTSHHTTVTLTSGAA